MNPVIIDEYRRLNELWCAACARVKKYEAEMAKAEQALAGRPSLLGKVRLKNLHYRSGVSAARNAVVAEQYRQKMRKVEYYVLFANIKVDFSTWQK